MIKKKKYKFKWNKVFINENKIKKIIIKNI